MYISPRSLVRVLIESRRQSLSKLSGIISNQWVRKYSESNQNEKNVIKSTFSDISIPNMSIPQFIWQNHQEWLDSEAIVCGVSGRAFTYKQSRLLSRQLAVGFESKGLRPGQVISILLPNTPEYPLIVLGALEAGIIVSPINVFYTVDEVVNQLKTSGSVAIITYPEKLPLILEAQRKLAQFNRHQSETLKIFISPVVHNLTESVFPPNVMSINDLAQENNDISNLEANMATCITPEDIAILPFSSGTTGAPKGVCLTHRNVVANLSQQIHPEILEWKAFSKKGTEEVIPLVLPMYHIYGLVVIAMKCLLLGTKVVTIPKFDEKTFPNILKHHKATRLVIVPPLALYIGNNPNITDDHLKTIKSLISGAAPLGESDIKKCYSKLPRNSIFKQGYGLTESTSVISTQPAMGTNFKTVGNALPNTQIKIVDTVTGEPLPPNKSGELCVKGPQIMKCYLNNPEATAETIDKQGWLHTGDIAYYDEKLNLYIVDRIKELIKVQGFQVAPAELEEIIRSRHEVLEAGVIGIEDTRKGEVPLAFVALKPGMKVSQEDLKEYINSKVAHFKRVEHIHFIESIPKNLSGKILRKELKDMYAKGKI